MTLRLHRTYKVRHSKEPSYLYSLLHDYIPTRVLGSSDQHLLDKPKSSTAKASRAFRHSAPVVWNSLSGHTRCATSPRSFKQLLKTELFAAAVVGANLIFCASESSSRVKVCTLKQ